MPGGVRFATRVAKLTGAPVRYWLSGPAEDGYGPTLEKVLDRCEVPVTLGRAATVADAYAASDVIVFPSTWEGFGNPTIESIAARRPCAAFPYPVLAEILSSGVRLFSTEAPENVVKFLAEPQDVRDRYYDINLRRARLSYSLDELPRGLGRGVRDARVAHMVNDDPIRARRAKIARSGRDRETRRLRGAPRGDRRVLPRPRPRLPDVDRRRASSVASSIACVVLPLPIVFGYGVRAAEREDRGR